MSSVKQDPSSPPTIATGNPGRSPSICAQIQSDDSAGPRSVLHLRPAKATTDAPLSGQKMKTKQFLMFTRLLLKYLEQKDYALHKQAKAIVLQCAYLRKIEAPGYEYLLSIMQHQLRKTVGEAHWRRGKALLLRLSEQYATRKKYVLEALVECEVMMNDAPAANDSDQQSYDVNKVQCRQLEVDTSTLFACASASNTRDYVLGTTPRLKESDEMTSDLLSPPSAEAQFKEPSSKEMSFTKAKSVLDNECAICCTEYTAGDAVCLSKKSSCNHAFHTKCLIPWLIRHDNCPLCRSSYFTTENQN